LRNKIDGTKFAAGEDNLGFDLSLQGCRNANLAFAQMGSKSSTYYLSLVTSASREPSIFGVPFPTMNVLLRETAAFQEQRAEFTLAPIDGWGQGELVIDKWRENDGAVSSISQSYPSTGTRQPFGGEGIFAGPGRIDKGEWYFERLDKTLKTPIDHLDVVFGGPLNLIWRGKYNIHPETIYQKLASVFQVLD
jgi:hypothetical protein